LKWDIIIVGVDVLSAEVATLLDDQQPDILCLGAVLPGGLTRIRYLCKRLRRQFPKLRIIIGMWGPDADSERLEQNLLAAGADHVETSLLGLVRHLEAWRPAMEQGNHHSETAGDANGHAQRHADCENVGVAGADPAATTAAQSQGVNAM